MKKILAIILASLMLLAFVACDNEETTTEADTQNKIESTEADTTVSETESESETESVVELPYNSAEELLNLVWNALSEDYKFMSMGGDYDHIVNGPGKFHLDGENAAGSINSMLHYPTADFDKLQDAASHVHGMLANNYTCGAYKFADAATASAMVETLKAEILNTEWMCGFPEKLVIATAPGNYVIVMYGLGEYCVDPISTQLTTTIAGAEIVVSEVLMTEEW